MRLIDADRLKEELSYKSPAPDFDMDSVILGVIDEQPTITVPCWHRVEDNGPHWVSVFDDLPRHNAVVVVSDGKRSWDVGQYHFLFKADDRTIWWWKKHTTRKVLWWMYKEDAIPEPPKEDEHGN